MTLKELRKERTKIDKEIKEREGNSFIVIKRKDVQSLELHPISQLYIRARKAVELTEDSNMHQALNELYGMYECEVE